MKYYIYILPIILAFSYKSFGQFPSGSVVDGAGVCYGNGAPTGTPSTGQCHIYHDLTNPTAYYNWDGTQWVTQCLGSVKFSQDVLYNTSFNGVITFANPIPSDFSLFLNGQKLRSGVDYTVAGSNATLSTPLYTSLVGGEWINGIGSYDNCGSISISEIDGDLTNEIQTVSRVGDSLLLSLNGGIAVLDHNSIEIYEYGTNNNLLRAGYGKVKSGTAALDIALIGDSNYDNIDRVSKSLVEKLYNCTSQNPGIGFVDAAFADTDNPTGILRTATGFTSTVHAPYTVGDSPALGAASTNVAGSVYTIGPSVPAHELSKFTQYKLYFLDNNYGTIRYRTDGGTWVNVVSSGSGTLATVSVTGLTFATHTIEIELLTAGANPFIFYGANLTTLNAGVRIHKLANGGTTAAHFATRYANPITRAILTDLGIETYFVMFGTNDNTAGDSPATLWANVNTLISHIKTADADADFVLVAPMSRQTGTGTPSIPMYSYGEYLQEQAYLNGYGFFNQYQLVGNWEEGDAAGIFQDAVHLNISGGNIVSNAMLDAITGGDCVPALVSVGMGLKLNGTTVEEKEAQRITTTAQTVNPTYDMFDCRIGGGGTVNINNTDFDVDDVLIFYNGASSAPLTITVTGATAMYQNNTSVASFSLTARTSAIIWKSFTAEWSMTVTQNVAAGYNTNITTLAGVNTFEEPLTVNTTVNNTVLPTNTISDLVSISGGGTVLLPDAAASGSRKTIWSHTNPNPNSIGTQTNTIRYRGQNLVAGSTIKLYSGNSLTCTKLGTVWDCDGEPTISGSGTIDFASVASGESAASTIAVSGAELGDHVSVGATTQPALGFFYGWVSAVGVVSVKYINVTATATDPVSQIFNILITKK